MSFPPPVFRKMALGLTLSACVSLAVASLVIRSPDLLDLFPDFVFRLAQPRLASATQEDVQDRAFVGLFLFAFAANVLALLLVFAVTHRPGKYNGDRGV